MVHKTFDKFSNNYTEILNNSIIKFTGFDSFHFITVKLTKLRELNPSFLNKPINFLDYGCGNGNLYNNFHQYFPKANYFGVDISREMIKEARRRFQANGTFYEINSSEWKKNSYDLIFSAGVFHHIHPKDQSNVINDLYNLMSDTGKMLIWEHNPLNPFTRKIVKESEIDKDAIMIPPNKMKNLFIQNRICFDRIIYTGFFPKSLQFLTSLEKYLERIPLGAQYVAIGKK
tara:strand:+ start:21 stop:710 length:690 start_codon:yes stop_codon:yes gene_type:complete